MANMFFAMWLQEPNTDTRHLIMLFIGIIAVAVLVLTISLVWFAVKAAGAVKELTATAGELKEKMMPLLDEVMEISKTSRVMLQDAAPKVKQITDTLVEASDTLAETSKAARSAVQQFDSTFTDINVRTQRQVARVDGMVTTALTATVDAVETISRGIKVPTQKIVAFAGQAKAFAEGLLAKIRSAAGARSGQ